MADTHRTSNNLFRFMAKEFGNAEANRVFDAYRVGTSRHWKNNDGIATTFPQIDDKGRLCQLKVMAYNPATGKRMKKQDQAESMYPIPGQWIKFGLLGKHFLETMMPTCSKLSLVAI